MELAPLVSIITATYNRSNVLAFAIESVRWQTFQNWELWVIGDACTDDTEQVVASFQDSRIHFINLAENVGEQSGPNNAGGQYARGRYIAYLNHDDLWLPDHLEAAVHALKSTGADLVFTLLEAVRVNSTTVLYGALPITAHQPPTFVPASSWVLRRELLEEVGPWRYYQECYRVPSQDWLFRAWKAGKKLHTVPRLTVVAIPSGVRSGSYAKREMGEHQLYRDRIRIEPDFRLRELAALGFADEHAALTQFGVSLWQRPLHTVPKYLARHLYIRACLMVRIGPLVPYYFLRNARFGLHKGARIDHLRQVRGLPPLARKKVIFASANPLEKKMASQPELPRNFTPDHGGIVGSKRDRQSITADWEFLQQLIDQVKIKAVRNVVKENGVLTEVYRRDWTLDDGSVEQVFQVMLFPGGISAWHTHQFTMDRLFVHQGIIKVVLYDARQNSPTYGLVNEFRCGSVRPTLIVVPPGVWHGVQNISHEPAALLNIVDRAYTYEDPDHWRLPWDSEKIPYSFKQSFISNKPSDR